MDMQGGTQMALPWAEYQPELVALVAAMDSVWFGAESNSTVPQHKPQKEADHG
jgi:hypothetical protein